MDSDDIIHTLHEAVQQALSKGHINFNEIIKSKSQEKIDNIQFWETLVTVLENNPNILDNQELTFLQSKLAELIDLEFSIKEGKKTYLLKPLEISSLEKVLSFFSDKVQNKLKTREITFLQHRYEARNKLLSIFHYVFSKNIHFEKRIHIASTSKQQTDLSNLEDLLFSGMSFEFFPHLFEHIYSEKKNKELIFYIHLKPNIAFYFETEEWYNALNSLKSITEKENPLENLENYLEHLVRNDTHLSKIARNQNVNHSEIKQYILSFFFADYNPKVLSPYINDRFRKQGSAFSSEDDFLYILMRTSQQMYQAYKKTKIAAYIEIHPIKFLNEEEHVEKAYVSDEALDQLLSLINSDKEIKKADIQFESVLQDTQLLEYIKSLPSEMTAAELYIAYQTLQAYHSNSNKMIYLALILNKVVSKPLLAELWKEFLKDENFLVHPDYSIFATNVIHALMYLNHYKEPK